jgi:folate-binding protein YgfZ
VYHVLQGGEHLLWLDATPGYAENLIQHMDRHLISEQVEFADRTEHFAQMQLAGPRAAEVLAKALGEPIPPLAEFQHMERTFGSGATCHVRRNDPLGVPGYDIVCLNERSAGIWQFLISCGARPAGLNAFEILRIEAGTPVYGIDIDENRFVMEVARPLRAVSYSKGCYLGQEPIVMARDRAGHVNRTFLGLKVIEGGTVGTGENQGADAPRSPVPPGTSPASGGRQPPDSLGSEPLPHGAKLFRGSDEVGVVTSSTQSPRLGSAIALGYVRRGHQDPGTRLEAETIGGRCGVEVLGFPPLAAK